MTTTSDPELELFLQRLEYIAEEHYRDYAACKSTPQHLWFDDSDTFDTPVSDEAARICSSCPVYIECLDNAIFCEDQGVRAGMNETQRNRLSKVRNKYGSYFIYDTSFLDDLPELVLDGEA